jgi:prefoldin subunit 5
VNANELANLLEVDSWYKLVTREEIATMLRQQQAEIEALKAKIDGLDMVIWKLQTTLSNRELRTYDGKLE